MPGAGALDETKRIAPLVPLLLLVLAACAGRLYAVVAQTRKQGLHVNERGARAASVRLEHLPAETTRPNVPIMSSEGEERETE